MLSPAKALRYECLAAPLVSGSGGDSSEGSHSGADGTRCQKRSLGNGYTLDLTETIPHVVKDGHKLVRNCSTGKTVYWVCRKRKYGCPKYVHTDSAGTFIKKELGEHNHEPNQNPSPSPDNQGAENASNEDGSEQTLKPEKSGKNNTASNKSSNLKQTTNENKNSVSETEPKEGINDERKPIDCANLVVSSVLAKAMSAGSTSSALFNNNNNNDQTLHSVNGRKKDVDDLLHGGGNGNNRKRKIMDDTSNLFNEQSFDDSVLDLSNAKDNVYQTSHQDSAGNKSHNSISLNSNNQLNALSFPCTNFQHIYHKFTKAIKAINCAGRKFRRLDPATSEGLLTWRCSEKFCRYTLYTDAEVTKILKDGGKHNHELDGGPAGTTAPVPEAKEVPVTAPAAVPVLPEVPQCATNVIPPQLQQPLFPPLLPTANDIAAVLAETNHLERLLKYQPADLLALMAKFTTDPTSFFNINHAAILPQIPPSISPLAAMPQTALTSLYGTGRDIRERSVSPASGSSQSRVILKRKQCAQGINGEGVNGNIDSNNHIEPFLGSCQTSTSVASEILDFSKQSEPVDIMGDDDGRKSIDLTMKSNTDQEPDDGSAAAPCSYVDSIKASSKGSVLTSNGSATAGSSESDGESSQPPNSATPTPLPEMPDIIRKEFSVINAPDGRNHILQNGHIFSKDKCSSKSVYWRCKKKLCFAIMHTDLDMTRITFRRGEHNHDPDPKIEQRARKGHFAKMPRKPRRRRVEIEADAAAARALTASKKKSKEDVMNTNPPISPIASVDGADCSMIQSTNMFNNNNDETPMESSDTAIVNPIFTATSSGQSLEDLALLSSLTGTSSGGSSSSESVTDDLLAILSEAASELKDSTAISDLRDLLSSNIVSDPGLLGQASAIGMTSPQDITSLAAAAAAAVIDSPARILNPHALGRLNKRMINNVLSKFL